MWSVTSVGLSQSSALSSLGVVFRAQTTALVTASFTRASSSTSCAEEVNRIAFQGTKLSDKDTEGQAEHNRWVSVTLWKTPVIRVASGRHTFPNTHSLQPWLHVYAAHTCAHAHSQIIMTGVSLLEGLFITQSAQHTSSGEPKTLLTSITRPTENSGAERKEL